MRYEFELRFLTDTVHEAWEKFKDVKMDIKSKGAYDCVTNIDFLMEKFISGRIRESFPDDRIIGEEFSPEQGVPKDRAWVLDPIDGTVNMSHGLPIFGVQSALFDGGEVVASVIYLPIFDETFTAVKGEGAYMNGKRIHSADRPLDGAVLSVGDYSHRRVEYVEKQKAIMDAIICKVGKIRHFGAASVDFSYVACGRTDGFIMFTRNIWDIYPGLLLCREAGAVICSPDGIPYDYDTCEGIAAISGKELTRLIKG